MSTWGRKCDASPGLSSVYPSSLFSMSPAMMSVTSQRRMSAFGTKRKCYSRLRMSAFGGKADIAKTSENVPFDPKRTCAALDRCCAN